ncbi:hypothetical protein LCGC14_0355460 [marine sediment metagenome]|uniref:N-acetyltransferase domain-containing protein n=1 Tax=marine sediment metagenome TaxID=412755 RepID=A0A0F9VWZ5_9ZZZZ
MTPDIPTCAANIEAALSEDTMQLVDLYGTLGADGYSITYRLLEERTAEQSISHRTMPTWEEHQAFVTSWPYAAWYLVEAWVRCIPEDRMCPRTPTIVGAVYLTKADEIGVFIFKAYQGNNYGSRAVLKLMEAHPRDRYLANINPANERSVNMFEGLGFRHIQNTYVKEQGNVGLGNHHCGVSTKEMLTYADDFIEKARNPNTTAVIVGRDKAREMADEIERLRAALLVVVGVLEIGPPGSTPGTLSEVIGALRLCDAVRGVVEHQGQRDRE